MIASDLDIDPTIVKNKILSHIKKIVEERQSNGLLATFGGRPNLILLLSWLSQL
ncbi:MAG: hypothetical protein ACFFC7_26225 [Candidatus Hermodarchaeota archaeon]